MHIDSIQNGIVLDHIQAGNALRIYQILHLDEVENTVAVIKNVKSEKMGRKDLIKIDKLLDLDLDALGFVDPNITISIIREGQLYEKKRLQLPQELCDVISCRNPRCITSVEHSAHQIFQLSSEHPPVYRCIYCETAHTSTG